MAEGYRTAYKYLEERYGNEQVICDTLVAQIYSLNSPADSVAELRSFYDAVEGNLRALESRGKDVNANDALRLFIQKRLPVTVRIELEKLRESAEWTLPLLRTLLRRHITQREAVEIVLFETQYDSPEHKFRRSGGQGTFRSSAQNLATGSDRRERTTNSLCCAFCKEKHFPSECDEYSDLTSRKERVRNRKLCWKCLRAGHQEIKDAGTANSLDITRLCVLRNSGKSLDRRRRNQKNLSPMVQVKIR